MADEFGNLTEPRDQLSLRCSSCCPRRPALGVEQIHAGMAVRGEVDDNPVVVTSQEPITQEVINHLSELWISGSSRQGLHRNGAGTRVDPQGPTNIQADIQMQRHQLPLACIFMPEVQQVDLFAA